jgi:hypothetical protein
MLQDAHRTPQHENLRETLVPPGRQAGQIARLIRPVGKVKQKRVRRLGFRVQEQRKSDVGRYYCVFLPEPRTLNPETIQPRNAARPTGLRLAVGVDRIVSRRELLLAAATLLGATTALAALAAVRSTARLAALVAEQSAEEAVVQQAMAAAIATLLCTAALLASVVAATLLAAARTLLAATATEEPAAALLAASATFLAAAGTLLAASAAEQTAAALLAAATAFLAATGALLAATVSLLATSVFLAAATAEHRVQKSTGESGAGYQHHADRQGGRENQLVLHREVPRFMTLNDLVTRAASSVSGPRACGRPDLTAKSAATSS